MNCKTIIHTDKAPGAIGPYSQGVVSMTGKLLFTAGQIPFDPETGALAGEDIKTQTEQALKNVQAVVEAGGSDLNHVLKTTVFLENMNDFAVMNEVYASFFKDNPPARSAVEVSRLPKEVLIEIECVAVVPDSSCQD